MGPDLFVCIILMLTFCLYNPYAYFIFLPLTSTSYLQNLFLSTLLVFLPSGPAIDDEFHFLIRCPKFNSDRNSLFTKLGPLNPSFLNLTEDENFKTLLCPTSAFSTKLVHRFIKQMFASRQKYDENYQISH